MSVSTLDFTNAAIAQWLRWGGYDSDNMPDDKNMEQQTPYFQWVGEYWKSINSNWTGKDKKAWSSAFICYCMQVGNVSSIQFPYDPYHANYCGRIAQGSYPDFSFLNIEHTSIVSGDILCQSRVGDGCPLNPPQDYYSALLAFKDILHNNAPPFCAHSDIVVEVLPGIIHLIGGNVNNTVFLSKKDIDVNGCIVRNNTPYIGIIRAT